MRTEEIETKKLKNNIGKYYLAAFLSGLAFFYNAIDTLYYRHFGLSFEQIGWAISASLIANVVLNVPSGAFADLYGKKKALITASLFGLLGTGLIAFGSSFLPFLIGFALWGAGGAFSSGASTAFLFDTLKGLGQEKTFMKHSGRLSSVFISVDVISGTLGPLIFAVNVRLPYLVSLVAAFLAVAIQFGMYEKPVEKKKRPHRVLAENFKQMKTSLRSSLQNKIFIWLTLFGLLFFIANKVSSEMIGAPFLINVAGFSLQNLSVIGFIGSAMQASFVFFADKVEGKLGDKRSFLSVILGIPLAMTLFALSRNLFTTAFLSGTFFCLTSFREVVVESYLAHNAPDANRATVLSISSMLVSLFALITLPLLGKFVDRISLQSSLLLLSMVVLAMGLVLLTQYRGKNSGG